MRIAITGRFVVLPFVLLFSLASAAATGSSLVLSVPAADGCQHLAGNVQDSLHDTLRRQAVDPFQWPKRYTVMPMIIADMPVSCGTTAAATSGAFSATFAAYGLSVTWSNAGTDIAGTACLSHYLSQCYPQLQGGNASTTAVDQALVDNAWTGVRTAVSLHMPFGPQSDLAYFQPSLLTATLETSLALSFAQTARPLRNSEQQEY